jgi:predicted RNA-binding protein with PIN domain
MHYLVDGHNLIGQMPNIELSDPDDEGKLIRLLHRWTLRYPRDRITVVFDKGIYSHTRPPRWDRLEVIFARSPSDADARLVHRLRTLPQPRGYTLVSADRAIAAVAAEHGVPVKASRAFAAEINAPAADRRSYKGRHSQRPRPEPKLPQSEVDAWLKAFDAGKDG